MTLSLALVALISAFGSSFQYGYNVSVINSPAPVGWGWERGQMEQNGNSMHFVGFCGHSLVPSLCLGQMSYGVPPFWEPGTSYRAGQAVGTVFHPRLLHPSLAFIPQLTQSGFFHQDSCFMAGLYGICCYLTFTA